jgi:hypothetical protein
MRHEEQTIRSFVVRRKRERYLEFVCHAAHRIKFTHQLAHFKDIDEGCKRAIAPARQTPKGIERILVAMGAPTLCYLITEHPEMDGKELPLLQALEEFVGSGMGAILSCIPGRLAFLETEDERWILEKTKPPLRSTPCVRFRSRLLDPDSTVEEGIFMAAYRLRDQGDIEPVQREQLIDLLSWFEQHLPAPQALEKEWNKTAICWFRSESRECISRVWSLVHLLEENGVVIDKITSEHPGWVVYEDKWQVVAHPI